MSRSVLLTGASVAGNTAAWWLGRAGFAVTVVERAPAFRDGGQNIDVRGPGREVLRRMGLERAALDRGTGEQGTAWVEEDGRIVARFLTQDHGSDGPTAEMEILRGDLSRVLHEPAACHATYRYDDSIAGVDQDGEGADVTFASGRTERYDAVIVAERVGARTRELVFPGERDPRWMDLSLAYFTIPSVADVTTGCGAGTMRLVATACRCAPTGTAPRARCCRCRSGRAASRNGASTGKRHGCATRSPMPAGNPRACRRGWTPPTTSISTCCARCG